MSHRLEPALRRHVDTAARAVRDLGAAVPTLARWGAHLAAVLGDGGRLLVAGNGGSAAQAQHLTSELIGRFQTERPPFSAICLAAEVASLTALGNDYGFEESFARQVRAHGRPGDVLVCLSTSGRSPNLLAAVAAARTGRLCTWAVTGAAPNPLAGASDEALTIPATSTAAVQEAHQVALHLLCLAFDCALEAHLVGAATSTSLPAAAVAGLSLGGDS